MRHQRIPAPTVQFAIPEESRLRPQSRKFAPVIAALAGALLPFGFSPLALWPLGIAVLAVLYRLVRDATAPGRALGLGGVFGLAAFGAGSSWVYPALRDHGGLGIAAALGCTAVFVAYLALFIALPCGFARWVVSKSRNPWVGATAFASSWVAAEWLRSQLFGGYSGLGLGYMQVDGPGFALAPIIGTYGLSWLSAWLGATAVDIGNRWQRRRFGATVLGLAVAAWTASSIMWTEPAGRPLSVRLLQANVDQSDKFRPEKVGSVLDQLQGLVTARRADLIVAPETALPVYLHELPPDYLAALRRFAADNRANVLLGLPALIGADRAANSMLAIRSDDADGGFYRYEKVHLMPFGEYSPAGFGWLVDRLSFPLKDLSAGPPKQRPVAVAGAKVGFMVCQEEMFGDEVARWVPEATLIVNPSNLAWFAGTLAIPQSLQIARMRALELGRPVLRVANTGITAIIDHRGRIVAALSPDAPAALEGHVQGRQGMTPFDRFGDFPVLLLVSASLVFVAVRRLLSLVAAAPGPATRS